jgi:tetratricopeptide (TPR) repeat protein
VFIGLRPDSESADIEATCRRLAQRWRSAVDSHLLDDRAQQQAKELLGGLKQVWSVLKDDAARKAYNRKLSAGKAPMVRTETSTELNQILGDLPGAASHSATETTGQSPLDQGIAYLENNNFQAAYRVLKIASEENPSCPDTNAALGWAAYHIKHQAKLDDKPEEFLELALAFEPTHLRALEYRARIALKTGELDKADEVLTKFIKLNPKATWAQRELSQIRSAQSRDNNRRFWRKGDDR